MQVSQAENNWTMFMISPHSGDRERAKLVQV